MLLAWLSTARCGEVSITAARADLDTPQSLGCLTVALASVITVHAYSSFHRASVQSNQLLCLGTVC
jgi:hypothetical protein